MSHNPTVAQIVQFGKQAIDGTAVKCTDQFGAFDFKFEPVPDSTDYTPHGMKDPTVNALNREHATWQISDAPLLYSKEQLALFGTCRTMSVTTTATGVYTWSIQHYTRSADTVYPLTVEIGRDGGIVFRVQDCVADKLSYTIDMSGVKFSTSGIATAYAIQDWVSKSDEVVKIQITGTPTGGTFAVTIPTFTDKSGDAVPEVIITTIKHNTTAVELQARINAALTGLTPTALPSGAIVGAVSGTMPGGYITLTFSGTPFDNVDIPVLSVDVAGLTGGTPVATKTVLTAGGVGLNTPDANPVVASTIKLYVDDEYFSDPNDRWQSQFMSAAEFSYDEGDIRKPVWLIIGSNTYDGTVETKPTKSVKFKVEVNDEGKALFDTYRKAGTLIFVRCQAIGAVFTTVADVDYSYTFTHDVAMRVKTVDSLDDTDGLYTIMVTGTVMYSNDWQKAEEMSLITDVASY